METYDVGYVPNLSERIGEVRSSSIGKTIFNGPGNECTFNAMFASDSWCAMSFAFSPMISADNYYYSYIGFDTGAACRWTGNYHKINVGGVVLISESDFQIRLMEIYNTNNIFFTMAAVYMSVTSANLLGGFEEIDI